MTRPRRVLTVVVERCGQCKYVSRQELYGQTKCNHPSKRKPRIVREDREPPPEWCPLPKETP